MEGRRRRKDSGKREEEGEMEGRDRRMRDEGKREDGRKGDGGRR